ncbi:hypothetical protein [Sedimentibacter sp.]|uniref:hypothetical protein n=1 Tax=Sedimentibacter sp. TaxID=1960295 RepID=UPI000EB8F27B|nr:hypothetical protein [Sedimentibacter sp.]HCX62962.1 hypothetical protein [Clostridiales bacterium]
MIKLFIIPIIFMIVAYFTAPLIGPEVEGAATFFLVAIGAGLGVLLNQFIFPKKSKTKNDNT